MLARRREQVTMRRATPQSLTGARSAGMMAAEDRKLPRVGATHVLVRVSTRDRFRSSYLKDVSEGGIFVRTEKPLVVGAEVVVDLLPPGWASPLRLKGQVVRTQTDPGAAGMGVKFEVTDT